MDFYQPSVYLIAVIRILRVWKYINFTFPLPLYYYCYTF